MLGSREVQAVLLAIITIASLASAALIVKGVHRDQFDAIGLLNEDCKIGSYPWTVTVPSNITLCLYIENHRDVVSYYMIVYKIADNKTLPTLTTPSPKDELKHWRLVVAPYHNTTLKIVVPVDNVSSSQVNEKIALVFELWRYNNKDKLWIYTGRWVHLFIKPVRAVIPGG